MNILSMILGAKTIKKNTKSTQNKCQTHHAKQYEVTSFLSTDCELSTETCSKNVYSLGFWSIRESTHLLRKTCAVAPVVVGGSKTRLPCLVFVPVSNPTLKSLFNCHVVSTSFPCCCLQIISCFHPLNPLSFSNRCRSTILIELSLSLKSLCPASVNQSSV